jgi:hypothetical protein
MSSKRKYIKFLEGFIQQEVVPLPVVGVSAEELFKAAQNLRFYLGEASSEFKKKPEVCSFTNSNQLLLFSYLRMF